MGNVFLIPKRTHPAIAATLTQRASKYHLFIPRGYVYTHNRRESIYTPRMARGPKAYHLVSTSRALLLSLTVISQGLGQFRARGLAHPLLLPVTTFSALFNLRIFLRREWETQVFSNIDHSLIDNPACPNGSIGITTVTMECTPALHCPRRWFFISRSPIQGTKQIAFSSRWDSA